MSEFQKRHIREEQHHSVIEVFGPTIQGEGVLAGQVTHFIRFAGCGFRCSWCDSMHAVDPEQVAQNRTMMSTNELVAQVITLGPAKWITLSGGDPCLRSNLDDLIRRLQLQGYYVSVETQGQFYQRWLKSLDNITFSPKPPSSDMEFSQELQDTMDIMLVEKLAPQVQAGKVSFKVVVFDEDDLEFARMITYRWQLPRMFLSVGTPVTQDDDAAKAAILDRYRWLCEAVAADPQMHHVTVLPQLHVLAWGTKQGV